jgi:hypothetical protein
MKRAMTFFTISTIFGQEDNSIVVTPLGLRIEKNGQDYLNYADQNKNQHFKSLL